MTSGFPLRRISQLTLGTAQLGMRYGIANRLGKPSETQAQAILDAAWENGITCLDTARAYGDAESRIGAWRTRTSNRPVLVSKLPALEDASAGETKVLVRRRFDESCAALRVERLEAYLTHRAADLLRPGVAEALTALKAEGRLAAFGVSAYGPEEIDRALGVPGVALVQAPVNAFSQGIIESGVLTRCRAAGVAVFARSVFLQGLFFLDPEALPEALSPARGALRKLRELASAEGLTVAELALAAVKGLPAVASIVIGVDSVDHLKANLRAASQPVGDANLIARVRELGRALPAAVIDPSQWPA